MYDSVNASAIPRTAEIVAGYVDGLYEWTAEEWGWFPAARHVGIAVRPSTNAGLVLDVETGDALPEQCPAWVRMRMAASIARPVVYCNRSNWPSCQRECEGLPVDWWLAEPGATDLVPGTVATQYEYLGAYDVSFTAAGWPGGTMDGYTQADRDRDQATYNYSRGLYVATQADSSTAQIKAQLADLQAKVASLSTLPGPSLQPIEDGLSAILVAVERIETALKGA